MITRVAVLLSTLAAPVACTSVSPIAIERPIPPALDVSAFQRVLVAGFIAGGTEEVDANLETVRLLRSQLRRTSSLTVIEADVLPLTTIAAEQLRSVGDGHAAEPRIRRETDLEPYARLFADVEFWKTLGEEYQQPLILTGAILFTPHATTGIVQHEREEFDDFGRRRLEVARIYRERTGFALVLMAVFIDGRTGTQLFSEAFREQILQGPEHRVPALAAYFELMDRVMPSVLTALSAQTVRVTRVLLR